MECFVVQGRHESLAALEAYIYKVKALKVLNSAHQQECQGIRWGWYIFLLPSASYLQWPIPKLHTRRRKREEIMCSIYKRMRRAS